MIKKCWHNIIIIIINEQVDRFNCLLSIQIHHASPVINEVPENDEQANTTGRVLTVYGWKIKVFLVRN